MAESAVNTVIQNVVPLLAQEVDSLRGVHREILSMTAELERIKSFLKDAESRAESGHEGAKTWVKQVREVAFRIEDVIDEYILHLAEQPRQCGFISFFLKVTRSITRLKQRHEIASEIQDIKTTIRETKEGAERYGFSSSEQSSATKDSTWRDPRIASLYIEEQDLVGIESHREELVSRLLAEESERAVISLVGMAGVGKTTLAKKVYDNKKVAGHFNCCAWIPVSQSYKMEEILRTMIKQFYLSREEIPPEGIDTMEENSLINKLREYLHQKRYVIVFDDVWETDFWRFIKHALPKNSKGSRVVITTRSKRVANFCKETLLDHVHKIQPLHEEEAWELFCMKAFQWDFEGRCPPELEQVSHAIVRKCEGLPLAIVAIGGLLSTKNKVVSEWQKFYHSLGSELERNLDLTSVKKIVLLSYHDLPYYLKPCFLYFGIIPEDYSISSGRLIRLWIAEGFIEEEKGKTLEEVAEEYLVELIYRSLVQVSELGIDGKARKCRIHDIVREIILSKSDELSFCQVLVEENSSFNNKTRRLSMHMNCSLDRVLKSSTSKSQIRSVFLFSVDQLPKKPLLCTLAANFKLLKRLDLQDAPLDKLHEEVGILFHLRYLSVRNTKVKVIPKSIGKLLNLQTLDLKYAPVCELPIEISRLRKLRHLLAFCSTTYDFSLDGVRGVKIHGGGIGRLEELQKLWYVEANDDGPNLIRELENLKQLRKLGITKLKREDGRALGIAIENMKHLKSLQVLAISEDEMLDLLSISSPPESLQKLSLSGRLEKLPDWIPKLQNLVSLDLNLSGLTEDPLKALQALPNLVMLGLGNVYDGKALYFEAGGFQKLKRLDLANMEGVNSVMIEDSALPLLEKLLIGNCPQLKEVPSGIRHLRKLARLLFVDMSTEFLERMRPDKGQDYWIVRHIPLVVFGFRSSQHQQGFEMYTLQEFYYHASEGKSNGY